MSANDELSTVDLGTPWKPGKMGRPPSILLNDQTLKSLMGLGKLQATTRECAAFFGCCEKTFLEFMAREENARAAFDNGKGHGLVSLRRKQFKLADTNATMAIHLGKNYLGQSDKTELEHSGNVDHGYVGDRVRRSLLEVASADGSSGDSEEASET